MYTFFKMYNNWFYKFISELSLYAEYLFRGVDRSLCGHTWYNMHYTTAKVILVFHVQYIMKMLMKANVYWNGQIKMFWKFKHCWLLKCLIHFDWSDVGLLQTTYSPCICPTQVIALILAPPLPHLTCIIVWPVAIYHNSSYILCIHILLWWKD